MGLTKFYDCLYDLANAEELVAFKENPGGYVNSSRKCVTDSGGLSPAEVAAVEANDPDLITTQLKIGWEGDPTVLVKLV